MRTHSEIIVDGGGATKVGLTIDEEPNNVQAWKRNDSIPQTYWKKVVAAEISTYEELAEYAATKVS